MEYVYAALILHQAGKKVDENSIRKIIESAGIKADDAKIKALVSSLDGVDISKTLEEAKNRPAVAAVAPSAHAGADAGKSAKKEEKEEEKKQEAAEGLSALFG